MISCSGGLVDTSHALSPSPLAGYVRHLVFPRLGSLTAREVLGRSLIKQSLCTRDPAQARARSYALSAKCAQIFAAAQGQQRAWMSGKHWDDRLMGGICLPHSGDVMTNSWICVASDRDQAGSCPFAASPSWAIGSLES